MSSYSVTNEYIETPKHAILKIKTSKSDRFWHVLIDKEDQERVREHTWVVALNYAVNGRVGSLHRFVLNLKKIAKKLKEQDRRFKNFFKLHALHTKAMNKRIKRLRE